MNLLDNKLQKVDWKGEKMHSSEVMVKLVFTDQRLHKEG